MERLAIIGTGIAGMAAAYHLYRDYDLVIYEKENRIGGHTNTVEVEEAGQRIPVDTGFMVFNGVTYPELNRLFRELQVDAVPTDMSFGVQDRMHGLYYSSRGWRGFWSQRGSHSQLKMWELLADIHQFRHDALSFLRRRPDSTLTLREFLQERDYKDVFCQQYILPMSSAIWSCPPDAMMEFPARTLFTFFRNHALLGISGHHRWYTVAGGSRTYRDRLTAPFQHKIRQACAAVEIRELADKVEVVDSQGHRACYDQVIVATHADEALQLISRPTPLQQELLSAFPYSQNRTVLHTDRSVMPPAASAWASWNFRMDPAPDGQGCASTHYWMNALQPLPTRTDYFVSLNAGHLIDPAKKLWETCYTHPIFNQSGLRAQRHLPQLNQQGRLRFCGSYFRYGFHEDALVSALNVVQTIQAQQSAA